MDGDTGFLTLLMNFVAPLVLGLAILYLVLRLRRVDWRQRQRTEKGTEDLYERVDHEREQKEQAERRGARGH
mgnify:FL=1|jgi:uncharacterized membrane-anchored protein YhcB (DUF1043 family)